ncbi:MAG: polyprenyl synthetase family protein [Mycetocola sp.]
MTESSDLRSRVDTTILDAINSRTPILRAMSPELDEITSVSLRFLSGGKRLRALFCYRGWESVTGSIPAADSPDGHALDLLATALELFHAAALVHDDLIDNSDTRRGLPSAHQQFSGHHDTQNWSGDRDGFGRSAAILLGDVILAWSNDLLDEALQSLDQDTATAVRAEYSTMRLGVTLGQYLDVAEEHAWPRRRDGERVPRALDVITHKSARYSVEHPLVLGALAAGAPTEGVTALRRYALPLGIAFQLRDDQLGVFGDSAVTGKPAGDDLREGKRTVLIARAIEQADSDIRDELNAALGDRTLSDERVAQLSELIISTGASDDVERMIRDELNTALDAVTHVTVHAASARWLTELAHEATRRSS